MLPGGVTKYPSSVTDALIKISFLQLSSTITSFLVNNDLKKIFLNHLNESYSVGENFRDNLNILLGGKKN